MNARPERRFAFRLAGHLHCTHAELLDRMDSAEFSEWIALDRFFERVGDQWLQTGLLAAAILAPHSKTAPDPKRLIGLDDHVPRHRTQDLDALKRLQADLG